MKLDRNSVPMRTCIGLALYASANVAGLAIASVVGAGPAAAPILSMAAWATASVSDVIKVFASSEIRKASESSKVRNHDVIRCFASCMKTALERVYGRDPTLGLTNEEKEILSNAIERMRFYENARDRDVESLAIDIESLAKMGIPKEIRDSSEALFEYFLGRPDTEDFSLLLIQYAVRSNNKIRDTQVYTRVESELITELRNKLATDITQEMARDDRLRSHFAHYAHLLEIAGIHKIESTLNAQLQMFELNEVQLKELSKDLKQISTTINNQSFIIIDKISSVALVTQENLIETRAMRNEIAQIGHRIMKIEKMVLKLVLELGVSSEDRT